MAEPASFATATEPMVPAVILVPVCHSLAAAYGAGIGYSALVNAGSLERLILSFESFERISSEPPPAQGRRLPG